MVSLQTVSVIVSISTCWFFFQIAKTLALLCLTQVALAQYYGNNFYAGNNGFQMRPEDQAAIDQIGSQGVQDGTKALRIATELVKGVFPQSGPIVRNGQIQTKWGAYALPNPQDADFVEGLLQATRDMINKMQVSV